MYAIRSYYGMAQSMGGDVFEYPRLDQASLEVALHTAWGHVITSYSIHYTKLYEPADRLQPLLPWPDNDRRCAPLPAAGRMSPLARG